MMIERLLPGETYEVGNVYVGSQGFVCATRSVSSNRKTITRTPENKRKTKRKRKSYSEKSRILSGLNIYNKHSVGVGSDETSP